MAPTPPPPRVDGQPSNPGLSPAEVEWRRERTEFLNNLIESGVRLAKEVAPTAGRKSVGSCLAGGNSKSDDTMAADPGGCGDGGDENDSERAELWCTLRLTTLTWPCSSWRPTLFTTATDDGGVDAAPLGTATTFVVEAVVDTSPLLLLAWWRTLSLFLFRLPDSISHRSIMTPQQEVTIAWHSNQPFPPKKNNK